MPAYAWGWLQRSRPVVAEVAARLTGGPPRAGLVDDLRERFETDAFTRDVVIGAVADVAFGGRVPRRRPAGPPWDRGLTWWAAAIAGVPAAEFERAAPAADAAQRRLFDVDPGAAPGAGERPNARPAGRGPSADARRLLARLRELLAAADAGTVPAAALRALLDEFDRPAPS